MLTGTLINSALILFGSLLGVIFANNTRVAQSKSLLQIIGTFTVLIGIQSSQAANTGGKFVLVMAVVLIGGAVGAWLQLQERCEAWAKRVEKTLELKRLAKGRAPRKQELLPAFVTASILFCVGPMAILGSLDDGIRQDPSLLITKGILDGTVSIPMAATLGIGILFSAFSVLVYQGTLTLLATQAVGLFSAESIQAISASGGVLLIFIGTNVMGATKISVLNLLPGVALAAAAAHYYWR